MAVPLHKQTVPPVWRFALIGVIASLPATAILNWLPSSEATIGGGVMILGAFIAGAIAVLRSSDAGAAGLRAGFIGGVLGVLILVVTAGKTAISLSRVAFVVFASAVIVCFASLFGLGFGRVGGWVANTVGSRWTTSANV